MGADIHLKCRQTLVAVPFHQELESLRAVDRMLPVVFRVTATAPRVLLAGRYADGTDKLV